LKVNKRDSVRIIQAPSTSEAIQTVATLILEKAISHPRSVLGLATGRTMIPVYSHLEKLQKIYENPFRDCFFFMLDEYQGLTENHPSSFKSYMKNHFINPLGLKESQFAFPPADLFEGDKHYEDLIRESGGVDLQLLGLGLNGHVGFNEPGSLKNSRTRVIPLTENTLTANRDQFTDIIPSHALSMGIGTILESKELLMLVTGKAKADIVKYILNHHDDPNCPATYLKSHPHFTLVLDPEAASKINLNI
jgi:glucosamine-6-phosphate deaminase